MDLPRLIAGLSRFAAYVEANPGDVVEVHQTHISVVFLVGSYAYKIKKPVSLGFLNYQTLERRRHYCEEEVRINRRLAPRVYLGVVPVTCKNGALRMDGAGKAVEWAVKMARLPEDTSLRAWLRRGEIGAEIVESLARRIAAFQASAETSPEIASFGRLQVVAENMRDNLEQASSQVGSSLSRAVLERLRTLTEVTLTALAPAIEDRARQGVPCDGHGDLRLDHIYLFPGSQAPDDVVIVDAIEFNERFRYADPVADIAFLIMELALEGRRDLARKFADAYDRATNDEQGRALLPFYTAYRATVRGKVEGIKGTEPEVPEVERAAALNKARALWLLALGELEVPGRRPCLLIIGGLPGVGKSSLAHGLAERAGFDVIRSDAVRKLLAALSGDKAAPSAFETGLYAPEWTERTYAECLRLAQQGLFEGRRVLIDASFRTEEWRQRFLTQAAYWGVRGLFLQCTASPSVVQARLQGRRGDASDANLAIYLEVARRWQDAGPSTRDATFEIDCGGSPAESLNAALQILRDQELNGQSCDAGTTAFARMNGRAETIAGVHIQDS